jgi:inhibitor of cysteine peptidase
MTEVRLTEADTGRTLDVGLGDEIVVRLNENPTTGYRWQVERVSGPLEPCGDSFELVPDAQLGTGGVRVLCFRAVSPGSAHLELKHWQAWEGDRSIDRRFMIDVKVGG